MNKQENRFNKGNVVLIVLILVVLLAGGYLLYKNRNSIKNMVIPSSQTSETANTNTTNGQGFFGTSPTVTAVPTGGTSNSQIDSQMNNIQVNMNNLDQDQTSVTSINQNADNATK